MTEIITTTKSWGNSVGVILPKSIELNDGQEVILQQKK